VRGARGVNPREGFVSAALLLALAGITYASRAAALVFMPSPPPGLKRFLNRIPAPLFASLAAVSLIDSSGDFAPSSVALAAAGALIMSPRRSLLAALIGGLAGYALGEVIF
jgi:branched-subunit amino acid transport protein